MGNSNASMESYSGKNKQNCQASRILQMYSSKIEQSQKIFLRIKKQQFADQLTFYQLRHKMQKHVLKTTVPQVIHENNCCTDRILIKVQLECYIKLSQITTNQMQTLYLLLAMLYGYGEIYKLNQIKFFKITQDMIGVTRKGEIKVWINQNFAQNTFIIQNQENEQSSQSLLVQKILVLVENKPYQYLLPNQFKNFRKQQLKNYTFFETIMMIKKFARINNFRIPLRVQNLRDWNNKANTISVTRRKNQSAENIKYAQIIESQFKKLKRKEAIPTSTSPLRICATVASTTTCPSLYTSIKKNTANNNNKEIATIQNMYESKRDLFAANKYSPKSKTLASPHFNQYDTLDIPQEPSVQIYEPSDNIDISMLNGTIQCSSSHIE